MRYLWTVVLVAMASLASVAQDAPASQPSLAELAAASKAKAATAKAKVYDNEGVAEVGMKTGSSDGYAPCDGVCEEQIKRDLGVNTSSDEWREFFYLGLRERAADSTWVGLVNQYRQATCPKSGPKASTADRKDLERQMNDHLESESKETVTVVRQAFSTGEREKFKEFVSKRIKLQVMRQEFTQLSSAYCPAK